MHVSHFYALYFIFSFSLQNRKKKSYERKARLRRQAAEKKLALNDVAIDIHPIGNDFDQEETGNIQSTSVVRVCPESLDRVAE